MPRKAKTIILALDGVPFGMFEDLAKTGVMPNVSGLLGRGFFTPVRSTIPEISSVAWSSIITGTNPGEHGIFGFVDLVEGSYKLRFPNFKDLKAAPFWELYPHESVIINVPSTYPVRKMNGVHISGFVSLDFEKSVHPVSLVPELRRLDYQLDVDSQIAHTDMELFLKELNESLMARIQAGQYLWDYCNWDVFMLVFTGTDRLMHFLFDACEDARHKHHNFFLDHFKKIDSAIGEIAGKITEDDLLIILSDHGFERLEKDIYLNYLLASEGFLILDPSDRAKLADINPATKAFALDPGRIYVNQKGKYPAGSVSQQDKEACLRDLQELFWSLQIDGKKVIKHVYRKEDIYTGPCLDQAPDMILLAEKGFNLKASPTAKELASKGLFTGKHSYSDAFLFVNNKELLGHLAEKPSVIDVGKFIESHVSRN